MRELFDDPSVPMLHSMINSVVIAVVQTAGVLVLASLAGYGLARIPYRHANGVFLAILLTLMVPAAVTFVPTFVLVSTLGWVSTLRGLIVPGLFQAFAAFLFRQYFLNFPRELEEAARIDGLELLGDVLADRRAELAGLLRRHRDDHVYLDLELVSVAAGHRAGRAVLDGADRGVDVPDVADGEPARAVDGGGVRDPAAVAGVFLGLQRYIVQGVEQTGING